MASGNPPPLAVIIALPVDDCPENFVSLIPPSELETGNSQEDGSSKLPPVS